MNLKFLLGVGLIALFSTKNIQAQCSGWNWPEDKATAEEKNVLYADAVKTKNYRNAIPPWLWLMENAPTLNSSIYINGEKIYNALAKAEKDPVIKSRLVDSLLWVVDRRIEVCGQEKKYFPKKALYNYIHNIKNNEKTVEIFEMYEQVFDLVGKDLDKSNAQAYVTVLKVYSLRTKKLSDEEILDRYDRLIEVIDHNVSKGGKDVPKWEGIRNKADDMLSKLITVDCEFARNNLGPKFKKNPDDIKMAKRIFGFMLMDKCTDDPLWLESGKKIQEQEPAYGLAKNLGLKCKAQGDKGCAKKYFNEALELATGALEKADMYVQLGHMKAESGAKSSARELYRQALAVDGAQVEVYQYIGNLYFGSFATCANKENMVKDRLVYIAAYNQFKKAGNVKRMAAAKAQFPSVEEIFTYNYNKGDVMNIDCWIGEAVTLDTRD